jgi:hypothetical protein
MNPVDLVNHWLRHRDIDYEFRPSSYWKSAQSVLHYRGNEVAIVTIELMSTFGDVMSVRARPVGRKRARIEYMVVDQYRSKFVFEPHSSTRPLTLGQLIDSLDSVKNLGGDELDAGDPAWLRHGWVLCWNEAGRACSDSGDSVPYRNFTRITSEFYPDLARHYQRLIARWVNAYALSKVDDEDVEE